MALVGAVNSMAWLLQYMVGVLWKALFLILVTWCVRVCPDTYPEPGTAHACPWWVKCRGGLISRVPNTGLRCLARLHGGAAVAAAPPVASSDSKMP